MKYNRVTRRMFLQGTGYSLAIPFLTSLLPEKLWAQTAPAPKRFVSILSTYDYGHHSNWFPNLSGNPFLLSRPNRMLAAANGDTAVYWQPLREFAPTNGVALSRVLTSDLSPYLTQINLLRSLDFTARAGHDCSQALGGMSALITDDNRGLRQTPTIDHILNMSAKVNPGGLPLAICGNLGSAGTYWSMAPFNGGAIPATALASDLNTLVNKLFANATHPEAGQATTKHPKTDILSRVMEDYTRVKNSRNISAGDLITLNNALDKISDVQRSLTRVATSTCSYKSIPRTGDIRLAAASSAVGKALADIITAAIMCDTARVFTIGTEIIYGLFDGESFDHQTTSHTPFAVAGGKPQWQRMGDRHAEVIRYLVAPLIQNLSAAVDPANGRSYLYNSLVLKSCETAQVHGWGSHPALLAGNAGGAIQSGNYIDYSDRLRGAFEGCDGGGGLFNKTEGDPSFSNNYYGTLYNRLLVTILQSMGLSPAEYELDADNAQLYGRTDIGAQNANLTSLGGYGHAFRADISKGTWAVNTYMASLAKYDLRTFRKRLPML